MSFDNVLSSVQNGKADIAIAGLSYSEERAKVLISLKVTIKFLMYYLSKR